MDYRTANTEEQEARTEAAANLGTLERFEKSPRLAELKVAYRSRTKDRGQWLIRSPKDVEQYLRAVWNKDTLELVEEFVVVCLNGRHEATGWVRVASGGFNATPIDPRLIFGIALQTASSAIVVAHNHPSGSLEPSELDRQVTERLTEAGRLLGVAVLDHLILTRDGAFSFTERRLL